MDFLTLTSGILLALALLAYIGLIGFFTGGWFLTSRQSAVGSKGSYRKVSVVVAARNEEEFIADLLSDLLAQDYPEEMTEIIVVDDRSIDGTARIVEEFIEKAATIRIQLIKIDGHTMGGKKMALAKGVDHATGEIILTTDADCRVGLGWISEMVKGFQDKSCKMIFGPVTYFDGNRLSDHFQTLDYLGMMASGAGAALAGFPFMCSGASLAYQREAYYAVNGFRGNEDFLSGDDVFLLHKIKKEFGRKAVGFCMKKEALVRTYPADGFKNFISQRVRWASKSKGYKDLLSAYTALIVFIASFFMMAVFFLGFLNPSLLLIFFGFLIIKSLADFPLLWIVTTFTGQRNLLKWFLPFQLIYTFYIVAAGILSLLNRRKW